MKDNYGIKVLKYYDIKPQKPAIIQPENTSNNNYSIQKNPVETERALSPGRFEAQQAVNQSETIGSRQAVSLRCVLG
jgi:hypothetical protein